MKLHYKFLMFLVLIAAITTIAVAYPRHPTSDVVDTASTSNDDKVLSRSRRDMSGIFDSIANGVDGLMSSMKKMSDSVQSAFDSIFSPNNLKSITDGFMQFKNGVKDAVGGVFGANGAVAKGFKKIGDKLSGGGSSSSSSGQSEADTAGAEES